MTPYLQLGMLTILKMPLVKTIGTTMLARVFISLGGSIALASQGMSRDHILLAPRLA